MKLQNDAQSVVFQMGEMVDVDFSIGDAGVVIEILRNRLYAYPIRTVVQEYLCNARDACRELHNTSDDSIIDIDVHLPVKSNPILSIRDYGPGLSPERIRDVFVRYGSSTKRTNNQQTGGFGIGAKSAWAYTDSFIVTSFYNGLKTVYCAHIGKGKQGSFSLIDSKPTDEKNGVEILINVQVDDIRNFHEAYVRAVLMWQNRPRLTNTDPDLVQIVNENLSINIIPHGLHSTLVKDTKVSCKYYDNALGNRSYDSVLTAVDGILYPINIPKEIGNLPSNKVFERALKRLKESKIVLNIPMALADISASREAITINDNIINVIKQYVQDIIDTIAADLKDVTISNMHAYPNLTGMHLDYLSDKFKQYSFKMISTNNPHIKYAIDSFMYSAPHGGRYCTPGDVFIIDGFKDTYTVKNRCGKSLGGIPIIDPKKTVYVITHSMMVQIGRRQKSFLKWYEKNPDVIIISPECAWREKSIRELPDNLFENTIKELNYTRIDDIEFFFLPTKNKVNSSKSIQLMDEDGTIRLVSKASVSLFKKRYPNTVLMARSTASFSLRPLINSFGKKTMSFLPTDEEEIKNLGLPIFPAMFDEMLNEPNTDLIEMILLSKVLQFTKDEYPDLHYASRSSYNGRNNLLKDFDKTADQILEEVCPSIHMLNILYASKYHLSRPPSAFENLLVSYNKDISIDAKILHNKNFLKKIIEMLHSVRCLQENHTYTKQIKDILVENCKKDFANLDLMRSVSITIKGRKFEYDQVKKTFAEVVESNVAAQISDSSS